MLKIAAIVSLMLIATWSQTVPGRHKREGARNIDFDSGSTLWAASLSCDSCGSECAAACGTRHFRSCCFNYLRRKRGPEYLKYPQNMQFKSDAVQRSKVPTFAVEDVDFWANAVPSDYRFNHLDDTIENSLQAVYEV